MFAVGTGTDTVVVAAIDSVVSLDTFGWEVTELAVEVSRAATWSLDSVTCGATDEIVTGLLLDSNGPGGDVVSTGLAPGLWILGRSASTGSSVCWGA